MKSPQEISKFIDNTFLRPDGTKEEISKFIQESNEFNFKTLFVYPSWVKYAKAKSSIPVGTVVGFPHGALSIEEKVYAIKKNIEYGAAEIDFVMNIGRYLSKDFDYIKREFDECRKACEDLILKVIIETCYLTDADKINVLRLAEEAGIDFVKTSTGFAKGGAKREDVRLMKREAKKIKIKAAGGIRTFDFALELIKEGAERIGTSTGIEIVKEAIQRFKKVPPQNG